MYERLQKKIQKRGIAVYHSEQSARPRVIINLDNIIEIEERLRLQLNESS